MRQLLLCAALMLAPLITLAQSEAISREVSVFSLGSPSTEFEAVSREVSVLNLGSPTTNLEAISREVSIFDTTNALPDLAVSILSSPPSAVAAGSVQLVFSITNRGDATATGPWTNQYLLAADSSGGSAVSLGTAAFNKSLPPGASVTVTHSVTLPDLMFGPHFLGVLVDSTFVVLELTKTNNTAFVPLNLTDRSFASGFEGATLDPFWSTYANAGAVLFPATAQVHSGSQSVALMSFANAGQKNIGAYHDFPAPIYGRASIWVYDSGADEPSGNSIGFWLRNRSLGKSAGLIAQDYDLGPSNGGEYYYQTFDGVQASTSVDRTKAWHEFTVTASALSLILQIDGQVVYSGPGGVPFDRVEFEIDGPTWRPAFTAYFDDFELLEFPPCGSLMNGLVGWWPGEGDANDVVGANNGTLQYGAGFGEGVVGNAFRFNGSNSCVMIPFSTNLISPTFSIGAWVKPEVQIPQNQSVWVFGEAGHVQLQLRGGTNGLKPYFNFKGFGGLDFAVVTGAQEIPVGSFTHLVGTWDGVNQRIYLNGVLSAEATPATTALTTECPFFIGGAVQTNGACIASNQFLSGLVDEPVLYSRALDPAEVAELSADGSPGVCSEADLSVTSVAAPDPIVAGNNLTLTVTVSNRGPNTATDVVVTNLLPAGSLLVSATASQGACTNVGGNVVCDLGSVYAGTSALITLVMKPTIAATITNVACVGANEPDFAENNNSSVVTSDVIGAAASFQGLGDLTGGAYFSEANGVSSDGTVVVGTSESASGPEAFRWSGGTMVGLGDLPGGHFESRGLDVSADGQTVVGESSSTPLPGGNGYTYEAFRWRAGQLVGLGFLSGWEYSEANAASANGSVLVGHVFHDQGGQACRWDSGSLSGLGFLPGDTSSLAFGVSADGSVIVGRSIGASRMQAVCWHAGALTNLGDLPGGALSSQAYAVSADGNVIVGVGNSAAGNEAFRWQDGVMAGLGDLPGGSFASQADGVSGDGTIVVGYGSTSSGTEAFIWDATNGMRNLKSVLSGHYGLSLTNWQLLEATAISSDGTTIVGRGINPLGESEGWVAGLSSTALGADLAIAANIAAPVFLNREFTCTITVSNQGPGDAAGVVMTNTLSGALTIQSVNTSQGSAAVVGGAVVCSLGALSNGAVATVTIEANATGIGSITYAASVSAATIDPDLTNNVAAVEAIVQEPITPKVWELATIPGLPGDRYLGEVWARNRNEVYVWTGRAASSTNPPEAALYRTVNGGTTWSEVPGMYFTNEQPADVFGVGSAEVFAAVHNPGVAPARMFHSADAGTTFTEQALPATVGSRQLRRMSGTARNVHLGVVGGSIVRFDGTNWTTIYSDYAEEVYAHTVLSPTEGYYVTCWGWGTWDGKAWRFNGRQFDFCDLYATWAMHDSEGNLDWYAVGNNNFANGVRVWKFDSASQSFGGKTNFVFGDGNGYNIGSATGIWGSAPNDVYVIGGLASSNGGVRSGRVYHFDGNAWSRVTDFGEIPPPAGISGTASDDIWISLSDGRLLHLRSQAGTNDPPTITTAPTDQSVVVNRTGVFSVAAQGTTPMGYQWYFNDTNALTGATDPVLVLPQAQPTNGGNYQVIITNAFGAATSAPVTLTIVLPPTFDKQPRGASVTVGTDVTLTVIATGATQFQWRKNGANIQGATNSFYVIPNAQYADGGSYTVVVANEAGAVTSDPAEVIVTPLVIRPAVDMFTNRMTILLTNGSQVFVTGFSTNATKEPYEPDHAGRTGGRSVWFIWHAPATGVARLNTYGSTFDTLLAVYTGTVLSNLVEVAANDDDDSNDPNLTTNRFFASQVRFNATAGTDYQIALDGFGGEGGYFVLSGEFDVTNDLLPVITNQPQSQVQYRGSNVTFTVQANGDNLTYQWYFNGTALATETNSQLLVPRIGAKDVGIYSVRVIDGLTGQYLDSHRALLEISSDPNQEVVFEDKVEALAARTGAARLVSHHTLGNEPISQDGFYSVSAGTVGYHLGNNVEGSTDAGEINHAGLIGNASLWLKFVATNSGVLVIDTGGSAIDTVFAVYRWEDVYATTNNGLLGYATNAPNTIPGNSVLVTNGPGSGRYVVAADGIKGQRGVLEINWSFGRAPHTANPTVGPSLPIQQLEGGADLVLQIPDDTITNAIPRPVYRWYRDGQFLKETITPYLLLPDATLLDSGSYQVVAINALGAATNLLSRVLVSQPIGIGPETGRYYDGNFEFTLSGTEGDAVVLQATSDLRHWTKLNARHLTGYAETFVDTNAWLFGHRFYRLVREGAYLQLSSDLSVANAGLGTNGDYQIILPPSVEVPLVVEISTNLHDWIPIMTNQLSTNATIFADPETTDISRRFYRLRLSR